MAKIAFIFPGQGSQYSGMGKDLYERFSSFRNIMNQANEILGYDLAGNIFQGSEEALQDTLFTQRAVFSVSVASFSVLCEEGIVPQFVAGHSLGEYSALVASDAASFEETLKMVVKRAEFIQEASKQNPGGMVAILGLDKEVVNKLCREAGEEMEPVNFNCPGQIVVSGTLTGCSSLEAMAKKAGAKRAVMLKVSGPFHHSKFMLNAHDKMAEFMRGISLKEPKVPFISNRNGRVINNPSEIKQLLIEQTNHPVLWEDCIKRMLEEGVGIFIEVGPGRTLTGLLKRISQEAKGLNVANVESLNDTLEFLKISVNK